MKLTVHTLYFGSQATLQNPKTACLAARAIGALPGVSVWETSVNSVVVKMQTNPKHVAKAASVILVSRVPRRISASPAVSPSLAHRRTMSQIDAMLLQAIQDIFSHIPSHLSFIFYRHL